MGNKQEKSVPMQMTDHGDRKDCLNKHNQCSDFKKINCNDTALVAAPTGAATHNIGDEMLHRLMGCRHEADHQYQRIS